MSGRGVTLLFDLGGFWREWFATLSQLDSQERIINRIEFLAQTYDAIIVCADSPASWRRDVTRELIDSGDLEAKQGYKSNRPKKAPEAVLALQSTEDRLRKLGFPVVRCDGYEADDVIATLVHQAGDREIHISSEDKDLYQLISPTVTQLTRAGYMDADACRRKFGVGPELMGDLLAVVGDTADNIQGCDRVGAGKGATLLETFGSIDGIKAATRDELTSIKGIGKSVAEAIEAWDPTLARRLVALSTDCPVNLGALIAEYSAATVHEELEGEPFGGSDWRDAS